MDKLYRDMTTKERKELYLRSSYVRALMGYNIPGYSRYLKDADRLTEEYVDTYIDKSGVIRWKSSNNVPPTDILLLWKFKGKRFDFDRALYASSKDLDKIRKSAIERERTMSAEERFDRDNEMRAAFGEGVNVVNVLTGKVRRT